MRSFAFRTLLALSPLSSASPEKITPILLTAEMRENLEAFEPVYRKYKAEHSVAKAFAESTGAKPHLVSDSPNTLPKISGDLPSSETVTWLLPL